MNEFNDLESPHHTDNGWYVEGYPNSEGSAYFSTKTAAYLASINYYVKYGRDYPHAIHHLEF